MLTRSWMVMFGLLAGGAWMPAEAQTPELPATMTMRQWIGGDSWTWTLTKRAGHPVFDATARNNGTGVQSRHVFELRSFDGKAVAFYRQDAGFYRGTVSGDGRMIQGKTDFATGNEGWEIELGRAGTGSLGARLTMQQWIGNERWTWTLTRRGGTSVYDAVARNEQSGALSNHVFELRSFDGQAIAFYRQDAGFYRGTMAGDGRTAKGTVDFAGGGWTMQTGEAEPVSGTRYRVENLVFKAPDVYQNPRNYHDFLVDFGSCTVRPMVDAALLATLRIEVHVCRPGSRLTFTQRSTAVKQVVEYDWVLLNGGKTVAGAWHMESGFGPSVGGVYP